MATFSRLQYQNAAFPNNLFFKVDGPLTEEDIDSINRAVKKITIVFDNTKGQNPELIRKINNPNVTISVLSGLDYLHKNKFQKEDYLKRTFYNPNELASIVEFYQKLESGIRYTWTDRQKAMYIYKQLCEYLHYCYEYEPNYVNGVDITRSLKGLLHGRLVCVGFAMVFKEAMDRLGIPCHYQNIQRNHSFNVIELEGKKYGIDLTWDCYQKRNNRCGFAYFGFQKDFYGDPNHNLKGEPEETEFVLSTFTNDELVRDIKTINTNKIAEKRALTPVIDGDGYVYYNCLGNDKGVYHYVVYVRGQSFLIHTRQQPSELYAMNVFDAIQNDGWDPMIPVRERVSDYQEYQREDRSKFVIIKNKDGNKKMDEYYYYDIVNGKDGPIVRRAALLSEMALDYDWDESVRGIIANRLLSRERVSRKIQTTRGYVGYLGVDRAMYYNRDFERDELNIINHVHKN